MYSSHEWGSPRYLRFLLAAVLTVAGEAAWAAPQAALDSQAKAADRTPIKTVTAAKARAADDTYEGTPVGFTADGRPFRGNPDAAVMLVEHTDYVCPFCARYFQQTLPALLEKYGRSGQVKFVVDDFPLDALHPTARQGAEAAACVAEQGAVRFWQMHDALFKEQQAWGRLANPSGFLADAANRSGVNMKSYNRCIASDRVKAQVNQRVAAAKALGFTGTPSFQLVQQTTGKTYTLVGAQPAEVFATWIDALLAGKEPPKAKEPERPELPQWAKAEGLAPDPKRPGFTLAGDAYKGNPDARLVLVEFEDFECPACQRHALATQPELDKRFVDSGEVLWVVKHFPLRIHPHAAIAAAAAECAGDQGKFWPMHQLLFERSEQWSTGNADAELKRLAADVDLDQPRFSSCLASRNALERVLRDIYDGLAAGVKSIPAFIMLHNGTAQVLTGARSADQFAATLQQQIENARSQGQGGGSLANR